jgi:Amt family ammonium transporter
MIGYDDALDAFGVHAVGAVLTGVFAIKTLGGASGLPGLIEGNPGQVLNQIEGVAIVLVYDVIVSLVILKLIDWTVGLRVTKEVKMEGLDLSLHGEVVQ